jgi:hypothetical protein
MPEVDPVLITLVEALAQDAEASAGTVLDVRPQTVHGVHEHLVVGVPGALWHASFGSGADLGLVARGSYVPRRGSLRSRRRDEPRVGHVPARAVIRAIVSAVRARTSRYGRRATGWICSTAATG